MTEPDHAPRLTVLDDPAAVGREAARRLGEALADRPEAVLLLPTGKTPLPMYDALSSMSSRGEVDLRRALTFNLDELCGVPAGHPGSYRSYMRRALFDRVPIPSGNTHLLDGEAIDPEAECRRYARALAEAGGASVCVLGVGLNGHVGFNEPGSGWASPARVVELRPESRAANAFLFGGDAARVPRRAMTLGLGEIFASGRIVVLATGEAKAEAVRAMLLGPVTTGMPASGLRRRGGVEVLLDRAAASRL